jgi:hypothetical protein
MHPSRTLHDYRVRGVITPLMHLLFSRCTPVWGCDAPHREELYKSA